MSNQKEDKKSNNVKIKDRQKVFKITKRNNRTGKIKLHNNDVTPIDAVVFFLMSVFSLSVDKAFELTMDVHNKGFALVFEGSEDECIIKLNEALEFCQETSKKMPILKLNMLKIEIVY